MLKKILLITLLSFLSFCLLGQNSDSTQTDSIPEPLPPFSHHLAFKFAPNSTGVITYYIVKTDNYNSNKIVSSQIISRDNFIQYGKGLLYSKANPERRDQFADSNINCGLILYPVYNAKQKLIRIDTMWEEMKTMCIPTEDLWRLKYSVDPRYSTGYSNLDKEYIGWAGNRYRPSWPQIQFLQNYGIVGIGDFFWGPKMFHLLNHMQDPEWIEKYKLLGG